MTSFPKTETRQANAAPASRQPAVAVIEQGMGPRKALYEANKSLAEGMWPQLTAFQVAWLALVATGLELEILRDEVIWYEERPYITIKGLARLLNRHPQFDNYEVQPAPDDIRKAMRVTRDEEQVWICRVWRKDRSRPATGYGRASPEDTFAGYGKPKDQAVDPERPYRTPATAEMAQERAIRHAAQGAFAWEFMSTLAEPASPEHRRTDPNSGDVSPWTADGSPNTVGCTAAQRRCIHALARVLNLPEGQVDLEASEVLEEGWRADLFRLYGKTSTMRLTVSEAREFIDSLTADHPDLDEPSGQKEAERREVWRRVNELLKGLPGDTPRQVCAWFRREHGLEVKPEELTGINPPGKTPTAALRQLVEGLQGYRMKLEG